ncbi:hypothetical protein ABEG17_01235 [Pedococcus sp. KACC 23699]|uniref:Uncharacterized protein n=1 Tax=Pedococcus sp. KACC 23699 TaxID=3149228 RepID=A0AAU7JU85_9MICO
MTKGEDGMAGPQYDFEAIKGLATKWGTEWDEKSTKALGHIKSGKLDQDAFSEAQAAQAFGALYTDAHAVYLATIEGVQKDLADFREKLRLAAETMEKHDGNAAAVMQTLASRWTSDEGFHSAQAGKREEDEIARKHKEDGTPAPSVQTEQTSAQDGGAPDSGSTAADGSGQKVYGGDGSGTSAPPPDDKDTKTESYASNQNPYANNAPQY